MASIRVSARLHPAEIGRGEGLRATVQIQSTSESALPLRTLPPPLTYEIQGRGPGAARIEVSAEAYFRRRLAAEPRVGMPEQMGSLAPGATVELSEDLSRMLPTPLDPGQYTVTVRAAAGGEEASSEPVALSVRALRIRRRAVLVCPIRGTVCSVAEEAADPGEGSLLAMETSSGDPEDGAFVRVRPEQALSAEVTGLATSALASPSQRRSRWSAHVSAGKIGAFSSSGFGILDEAPPVPILVTSPRLLHPGVQIEDGSALFLVAGQGGEHPGVTWIQRFVAREGAIVSLGVLDLCRGTPEALRVRFVPSVLGVRADVVWSEATATGYRIWARSYRGDGRAERPLPVCLCDVPVKVAALEIAPLGSTFEGAVHALLGPLPRGPEGAEAHGRMRYVVLPLDPSGGAASGGGMEAPLSVRRPPASAPSSVRHPPMSAPGSGLGPPESVRASGLGPPASVRAPGLGPPAAAASAEEWLLPSPPGEVFQWAVAPSPRCPVVGWNGTHIVYAFAADEEPVFHVLAPAARVLDLKLLVTPTGALAAAWIDPDLGPRHARFPEAHAH